MDRKRFGKATVVALTILMAAGMAGADEPVDTATVTIDQLDQGDGGQVTVSHEGEVTDEVVPDEVTVDLETLDMPVVTEDMVQTMTASAAPVAVAGSGASVVAASESDDPVVDCTLPAQRKHNILCK